jgi:hypothetical protein
LVSGIWLLFILGAFYFANFSHKAQLRLARSLITTGSVTCGTVLTKSVVEHGAEGDLYEYLVAFDAGEDDLRWLTERSSDEIPPGEAVTVLYSPEGPTRAIIYKLSDYRAAKPKSKTVPVRSTGG